MKVDGYKYDVSVMVTFAPDEVKAMTRLSQEHCDGLCKSASKPGGSLYGLMNHAVWCEASTAVTAYPLSWRDVDTLAKILESARTPLEVELYHQMRKTLSGMSKLEEEANK